MACTGRVTVTLLLLVACLVSARAGLRSQLGSAFSSGLGALGVGDPCSRDVTLDFRRALYGFSTDLYKQVANQSSNHFAVSQLSSWQALAALYEGMEPDAPGAEPLRSALRLPREPCQRAKYYTLAAGLEPAGDDVTLRRHRVLLLPPGTEYNQTWAEQVRGAGLLEVLPPGTPPPADVPSPPADVQGPVLLDSLQYSGMFTSAFADADVARAVPFKDDKGHVVGTVDMLRVRKRVKLAHLPLLNAKVVELPVGRGGRYRLLMLVNLGTVPIAHTIGTFPNTIIIDIFENLRESTIPLEVSVPRFTLRWEGRLGGGLAALGTRLADGAPARAWRGAPLQAAVQRVEMVVSGAGLSPVADAGPLAGVLGAGGVSAATGLAAALGRDFTADRPFMFGLVDAETRTCLFTGVFTHP